MDCRLFLCIILLFSKMHATVIKFSGLDWNVRSSFGAKEGPGPNIWDPRNVWVDQNGFLHLKVANRNGQWTCAEIITQERLGFGLYRAKMTGRMDLMDLNLVFAFFNYPDPDVGPHGTNEINIEFSKWGQPDLNPGAYVVYPSTNGSALVWQPFNKPINANSSIHSFLWSSKNISFNSKTDIDDDQVISSWLFKPSDPNAKIPQSPLRFHINFWLFKGMPFSNLTEFDIVVNEFLYKPQLIVDNLFPTNDRLGLILGLVFGLIVSISALLIAGYCCYQKRKSISKVPLMRKAIHRNSVTTPLCMIPTVIKKDKELQRAVDKFEVPLANVKIGDILLGKGEYGVVHKGHAFGLPGQTRMVTVAVKTIVENDGEALRQFKEEIKLMTKVGRHLNIVNLLGVVIKGKPLLLLEYCALGSLQKFLKSHRSVIKLRADLVEYQEIAPIVQNGHSLSVDDLINFGYQIARGMEYLSSRNIIHRDLATRNCLVCENLVIKICDFGLARESETDYNMESHQALPLKWMSPEAIRDKIFNQKSDVWSFGMTLWEIFSFGAIPCLAEGDASSCRQFLILLEEGHRLQCPDGTPDEMSAHEHFRPNIKFPVFICRYKIMEDCWSFKPDARPNFAHLRISIMKYVQEDYYLNLDYPYVNYNRYADIELEDKNPKNLQKSNIELFPENSKQPNSSDLDMKMVTIAEH